MAIPDIKFTILADPKPALQSMRTVVQTADQMYLRQKHLAENNAQRIKEIETKLSYDKKRIMEKEPEITKVIKDRIQRLEEQASRRIIQIKEREAIQLRHIQENAAAQQARMASRGGGGGGFSRRTLTGVRGVSMLLGASTIPGGSIMRAGIGGAEMGFAVGGGWGMAAGAVAGVGIAAASDTFMSAVNIFQSTANMFAETVTQLGGWKGISGSLVSGGRADTLAAQSLAMSPAANRGMLNFGNISAANMSLRKGSIFSTEDIAKARGAWVAKTGDVSGFENYADLIKMMATVSGTDITEQTLSAAQLRQQFQGQSPAQFRKTLMGQFSLSKLGEVPSTEVTQLAKATGIASMQPGREYENFMFLSSIAQRTAAGMGGGARVSTALARFYERNFKEGGFGFQPGADKNLRDVFEEATVQLKRDPTLAKGLGLPETQLLQLAGTHATGATPQAQKAALDKWINDTLKLIESEDQLKEDFKDVSDVAENQLKAAFNDLTDQINISLGPVIKDEIVPALKDFVAAIAANKQSFELIGKDLIAVIKALEEAAPLFGFLTDAVLKAIAAFIGVPAIMLEKLAIDLAGIFGADSEVAKSTKGLADSFMAATKGLWDAGEGIKKVGEDMKKISLTPPGTVPPDLVSVPHFIRPAAAIPYHGPGGGGGGSDRESVKWFRQLVRTSIEGNELVKEQNRKLDNMNPPDPSRSGQANK